VSESNYGQLTGNVTLGEGVEVSEGAETGTLYLGTPPHDMMSEEECLRYGGHCFDDTGEILTGIPMQYVQKCRHCGKGRVAVPREPFEYRDWPASGR
jgi:hypothetical protein